MKTAKNHLRIWKRSVLVSVLVVLSFGLAAGELATEALAAEKTTQITFDTPSAAGAALVQAAKDDDEMALSGMLGVDTKTLLSSGNKQEDQAALQELSLIHI